MDEHAREGSIERHITSVSARTDAEARRLVSDLLRRCWPAGGADRSEPGALDWVRRWGPGRLGPSPLECSCAAGRCRLCN